MTATRVHRRQRLPTILTWVAVLLIIQRCSRADEKPFGLSQRVAWTTSHVVGSPDPPYPYRTIPAFPKLKFASPLDVQGSPDGKRWFVVEELGRFYSFPRAGNPAKPDLLLDIKTKAPKNDQEIRRMWSMTFHPKYLENGFVFVCYMDSERKPAVCRIVRYTVPDPRGDGPPKCDLATEKRIVEWPARDDHFGGCLKFGQDGFLYFSIGDGNGYADGYLSGQDISDWQASIHRIDVDRTEGDRNYSVPKDNPFVNVKAARPEIWAYGLRNIWKMSFDRETGELWGGDVGQDLWDSIFKIEKGGNYGWSVVEGSHAFRPERKVGPTPILKPVIEHEHSQSRSITGGFVYHGKRHTDLQGAYVYGDFETGRIWSVRFDGKKVTSHRELVDTPLKLVGFGEATDGELVLLDYSGSLHELELNPPADPAHPAPTFPRKLSETGLFASTNEHTVAPGVIPYSVNSPLWSDNAHKERFMAVPGTAKVEYHYPKSWGFPNGSVLVKTFSLEFEAGNPDSRKRLETRILHIEQDDWRGYTYLWNDEQSDAILLEGAQGLDRTYAVRDTAAPNGTRQQVWHFPSRAECTLCHTMPAGFALGLSTAQLNREQDYGGVRDNQIRALEHIGIFKDRVFASHKREAKDDPTPTSYADLPHLADPQDRSTTLEARARSYLHANCAHCHTKWGGGNALFELQFNLPLAKTKTVQVDPQHSDCGIAGAKLLIPGDADHSLLLQRMRREDDRRMPRVGSSVRDAFAEELLRAWIQEMPAK